MIHKVIEHQCNGCELCIDECPVDCMSMIKSEKKDTWDWPSSDSEQSKNNYYQRLDRLERIKNDKELNRQKILDEQDMIDYIQYALDSESEKNKKIKKYE